MNVGMFENIPLELRQLPNWVLWRLEQTNSKSTKRPYQINGQGASVTNPNHWSTFDQCFAVLSNYTGLGFVFTNTDYSGIDLDDAAIFPNGEPNPNYQVDLNRQIKIAHEFDSYSEVSPSGKGLHIIVKGKVSDGKRTNFIELYPSGRFFTMTGNVHNNKPIGDYSELLNSLWVQMGGVIEAPIINSNSKELEEDGIIIKRATDAANGDKFFALHSGRWQELYPSQSEADFSYINMLAFYTQDRIQIQRIFQASALGKRDKAKRKDYVGGMITRSFDHQIAHIDFEGMKEALKNKLGAVAQRLEPSAHNGLVESSNLSSPTNFELPPGLLGEIASFIYQAAPRPVPEVAIAAAIGLMAGICGRAYNISGTGLNQYVLLLAMTGAGKEAAASGINKIMGKVKETVPTSNFFIGPSEISSGAALFKYLGNTSQSFISLLGEFGLRLQQMSSPNANGSEVSLKRMFLDLYNKSGHTEILHASVYSDKANNTSAIPSPSFSILGESTPERFYGALNEDMISEGLLPRFLLIEYKGIRPALNENHVNVQPLFSLISKLTSLAAQCESINYSSPRRVINVHSNSEAAKMLHDFDKYSDAKINSIHSKDVIKQLWNRAHIKVLKLSALIAVGNNYINPVIDIEAINWATKLVYADIAALTERFEAGEIGGNTFEVKQSGEIIRMIKDYIKSPYEKMEKYIQFKSPQMHSDKVIPYVYLNKRLSPLSAFRNDKSGNTFAIKRSIQNLIDGDRLKELGKAWVSDKYGTNQRCFIVNDLSILD